MFAVVFTFVISTQFLVAQNENSIIYTVDFVSSFELKILITVPEKTSNLTYYIFPESIPNYFEKKSFRNTIKDIKISANNEFSKYNFSGDTVFLPPNFNGFSYTVFLDSLSQTTFLPVQSAANEHLKVLNISSFLGYFDQKNHLIDFS